MKTLFLHNRAVLALFVLASAIFVSCEKHEIDAIQKPIDPQAGLASLKDSASYTINGKRYVCDDRHMSGRGNIAANRDSATGLFLQSDTMLYYTACGFGKQQDADRSDDGRLTIYFIRKYAKNQLVTSASVPALLQPENLADHYKLGQYRYTFDFKQDNRQNGINLTVRKVNGNEAEDMSTQPFVKASHSQDNSTFAITRFEPIGDGSYLLEAKFTANVFDANQTPTRVENGYMRFRVY
ncbi:hypothetical protein [Pontibacter oryzae]|uniref:Uncharacterized protein n=1 Tax=Pontibacter oryzae TaxID=2304593 RepID=A0A399RYM2_9BACT|nr:hypothetical protein [Pontibacter oryzae]RIJ37070.1 hypothetical protein D1627_14780 [Pontibacter oryzae]